MRPHKPSSVQDVATLGDGKIKYRIPYIWIRIFPNCLFGKVARTIHFLLKLNPPFCFIKQSNALKSHNCVPFMLCMADSRLCTVYAFAPPSGEAARSIERAKQSMPGKARDSTLHQSRLGVPLTERESDNQTHS